MPPKTFIWSQYFVSRVIIALHILSCDVVSFVMLLIRSHRSSSSFAMATAIMQPSLRASISMFSVQMSMSFLYAAALVKQAILSASSVISMQSLGSLIMSFEMSCASAPSDPVQPEISIADNIIAAMRNLLFFIIVMFFFIYLYCLP